MYADQSNRKTQSGDEFTEDEGLLGSSERRPSQRRSWTSAVIIGFLVLIITVQAIFILHYRSLLVSQPPRLTQLGLPNARSQLLTSGLLNRFWRSDELEGPNAAWAGVNSGHGIIKMDPRFAAQQGFPDTMYHPHDDSKLVYALESYHMIHCIQVLRKDFLLIRDGKVPTKPLEHAMHCFDALRQSVQCQASSELLVITGHGHKNGFNQTRQCRSWDALREYATEHTACYWDDEMPANGTKDRWQMCDDGIDGLPVGNLLE